MLLEFVRSNNQVKTDKMLLQIHIQRIESKFTAQVVKKARFYSIWIVVKKQQRLQNNPKMEKQLSNKTFIGTEEKQVLRQSTEGFFFLHQNIHKLLHACIGYYANSHCFKNSDKNSFPLNYKSQNYETYIHFFGLSRFLEFVPTV